MHDAADLGGDTGAEDDMVEDHVARALDRVGVDVAAATVHCREVKDRLDASSGESRDLRFAKVALDDLNLTDDLVEVAARTA